MPQKTILMGAILRYNKKLYLVLDPFSGTPPKTPENS